MVWVYVVPPSPRGSRTSQEKCIMYPIPACLPADRLPIHVFIYRCGCFKLHMIFMVAFRSRNRKLHHTKAWNCNWTLISIFLTLIIELWSANMELSQWLIVGSLLILPLLYELSSTFRYHAKFMMFYLSFLITASIVLTYAIFRPFDVRNHWFVYIF